MAFPRTKTPCPGCSARLLACFDEGAVFGGCDICGGVWLDTSASRRLIAAELSTVARDFVRMIGTHRIEKGSDPYRAPALDGERVCPACSEPLATVRLRSPNIDIDVCSKHGTYLDRGEIGLIWAEASVQAAEAHILRAEQDRAAALQHGRGVNDTRLVIDGAAFLAFTDW